MLVLSMDSKRQRYPNVRLGEIGDSSAVFACGFSQKTMKNLGLERWKHFVTEKAAENNSVCGFSRLRLCESRVADSGVSPRISTDMQQNRENKNPLASKSVFELVSLDEIDMSKFKLNFGTVPRKCRIMKRQGRITKGSNSVFGGTWSSRLSPEFSSEGRKESNWKNFAGYTSNACDDHYPINGFKDFSDREASAINEDAFEDDTYGHTYDAWQQGNSNCLWKDNAYYEGTNVFPKSGGGWNNLRFGGIDVNSVRRWLEELGFGKYAGLFKMHEVDKEALPLLTLEDLKEMGILAVGTRRKLYTAIQQLRGGV